MTHAPTLSPPLQGTPALAAVRPDWSDRLLRFIALATGGFLLTILWGLFVPEASIGVLRFVQRDTGVARGIVSAVVGGFFMGDIGQLLRGIKARHGMVFALSGQLVLAAIAFFYTLTGDVSLVGFAGHVGVFWVSLVSLWAIAQHKDYQAFQLRLKRAETDRERDKVLKAYTLPRIQAKKFLIPSLGLIMCLTAMGIITRPEGVIATFAQDVLGSLYFVVMLAWLLVGGGFIRLNHIKPKWLFVSLMGYWMFVGLLVGLLPVDFNVSFTAIFSHVVIAVESFFVIVLQAEYDLEEA